MTDSAPYAKSRVNRETNRSTPSLGNVRSEAGMRSLIDMDLANGSLLSRLSSRAEQLAISNCLVHHHPGDRFAILFLLRRVDTVSLQIHCEAVYRVLDSKVFELAVVIGAVLMKNGDGTAVARDVHALKPGVELDDIRPAREWQKRDGSVFV